MTTTYFLNCIMGNVFGTDTSPAIPTNYYLGLSKTAPTLSGSNVTEPSDSAYHRVSIKPALSEPTNGIITNTTEVSLPESTVDWGTCTHFVIYDAQSGGNLLMYNTLDKSRTIQSETQMSFKVGGITLTLRNPE